MKQSDLADEREELFARLLADEGIELSKTSAIKPANKTSDIPLSFAQQRLWFLNQLEPESAFFNISFAVLVSGPINISSFQQSLNEIVRRHSVLRTTFPSVEGNAIQSIAQHLNLPVKIVDLCGLAESEQQAEVQSLALAHGQCIFELTECPLLEIALLRLNRDEHVMLVTVHHIVSDEWSRSILLREVSLLYEALASGKPSPLTELSIQYADFSIWQRDWMRGETLHTQLEYWKKQLADLSPLQVATDRTRPPVQRHKGAIHSFSLGENLTNALKEVCQKESATMFMTLLATFDLLLYRYCGQDDIAVAVPTANRNRTEIESLIGFFVNTLVFRCDLSNVKTFRDLLKMARSVSLEAYSHQDLPFEKLVEQLQPDRDLSRHPLAQVAFDFHNVRMPALRLLDLTLKPLEAPIANVKFDLELHLIEEAGELVGSCFFYVDLFL
jgi:hypothetical protein